MVRRTSKAGCRLCRWTTLLTTRMSSTDRQLLPPWRKSSMSVRLRMPLTKLPLRGRSRRTPAPASHPSPSTLRWRTTQWKRRRLRRMVPHSRGVACSRSALEWCRPRRRSKSRAAKSQSRRRSARNGRSRRAAARSCSVSARVCVLGCRFLLRVELRKRGLVEIRRRLGVKSGRKQKLGTAESHWVCMGIPELLMGFSGFLGGIWKPG